MLRATHSKDRTMKKHNRRAPEHSAAAKALNSLPGDDLAAVVISDPGVYILTGPINTAPGKSGIRIDTDNVVIDLNGFALEGCEGSLDGITVDTLAANITVRNGDIRSWGRDGIDLSNAVGCTLLRVRTFDNGGMGMVLGNGARIVDCTLDRNRGSGGTA